MSPSRRKSHEIFQQPMSKNAQRTSSVHAFIFSEENSLSLNSSRPYGVYRIRSLRLWPRCTTHRKRAAASNIGQFFQTPGLVKFEEKLQPSNSGLGQMWSTPHTSTPAAFVGDVQSRIKARSACWCCYRLQPRSRRSLGSMCTEWNQSLVRLLLLSSAGCYYTMASAVD